MSYMNIYDFNDRDGVNVKANHVNIPKLLYYFDLNPLFRN